MSNALWLLATTTTSAPAEPPPSKYFIAILAVGIWVLLGWTVVRCLRPKKLLLARVPGRPNSVNALMILGVFFVAYLVVGQALQLLTARWAGVPSDKLRMPYALPAIMGAQVALGVLSLLVAAISFRHGIARGLGLSTRRWPCDLGRGVIGCLAVLPLCFGALWLARWLIRTGLLKLEVNEHPIILFLPEASWPWLVVTIFSTVLLAPMVEEIFYRGLIQSMLKRYLGRPWLAIGLASALFAAAHGDQYQNLPALFVLGLALGYNYERTGRLLGPILLHALFNAVNIWVALARWG